MAYSGGLRTLSTRPAVALLAAVTGAAGIAGFGVTPVAEAQGAPQPGPIIEVEAPIIIDVDQAHGSNEGEGHEHIDPPIVDIDDPDLIAEIEAVHEEFEAGTSVSVPLVGVDGLERAAVSSGMSVTFDATHTAPGSVQSVIVAAASTWDGVLATTASGPVEIAVIWRDLGNPSLLGSAGPTALYVHPGLPTSSYYPVPLANTLLSTDLKPGEPELIVNLNSTANWYIGTSGNPGFGQIDLLSVALHEIGHGLGFLGSASLHNHAPNTVPTLESTPFVFDHEAAYNGGDLLSQPNPNSLLTSNNLYLDVSDHLSEKLYAPGSWAEGSSFSHFDEATHPAGNPGSLMTPSLGSAETARQLDTPTLGLMDRIGWPMRVGGRATPTITAITPTSGQIAVNWGLDRSQTAVAPDTYRVEALLEGVPVAQNVVPASAGSSTLTGIANGNIYTVRVIPVVDGVDGNPAAAVVDLGALPAAPRAISADGSGLSRTITWLAPPGAFADYYEVQRAADGGAWIPVGTTTGTSHGVTVAEGVHQFRVRGHNAQGAGAWGMSIPTGIAAGIVRPVPLDGQVSRLYQAYFLRTPDDAGFTYWRDTRAAGASLNYVSDSFASSAEFVADYGALSNDQFVDLIYANVLGRPADAAGKSYWLSVLAGGTTRGQMMTGFSDSAEFVANTGTVGPQSTQEAEVYRLYVSFFLRHPDQAGSDYWVGQRNAGASLIDIAAAFAASTEFQSTYGSLDDADFVKLVYHNVLGRDPDLDGSNYWQWFLSTGASRGSMMTGFSESTEFIVTTGTLP